MNPGTETRQSVGQGIQSACRWVAGIVLAFDEACELRAQRHELLAMPDHMLKDMGITRIDAHRIAARGRLRQRRLMRNALKGAGATPQIDWHEVDAYMSRARLLRARYVKHWCDRMARRAARTLRASLRIGR